MGQSQQIVRGRWGEHPAVRADVTAPAMERAR